MPSYPTGLTVSNHALTPSLTRCATDASWWAPGATAIGRKHALLVVAYLRKGETYVTWPPGSASAHHHGVRSLREALEVLAALAPSLQQAILVAASKAFVIIDGTLLPIDRVAMTSGRNRPTTAANTGNTGRTCTCKCWPTPPDGKNDGGR